MATYALDQDADHRVGISMLARSGCSLDLITPLIDLLEFSNEGHDNMPANCIEIVSLALWACILAATDEKSRNSTATVNSIQSSISLRETGRIARMSKMLSMTIKDGMHRMERNLDSCPDSFIPNSGTMPHKDQVGLDDSVHIGSHVCALYFLLCCLSSINQDNKLLAQAYTELSHTIENIQQSQCSVGENIVGHPS